VTAAAFPVDAGGAGFLPRLRPDLTIVEQVFKGEKSFVVKDATTRKYFRFGAVEIAVMRCFDGRRTPDEIARALAEQGMRIPARTVEGFARKLSSIGVLERTLVERTTLELERLRAERRRRRQPKLFRGELMRMRWSMGDPDALFDRVLPAIRWCFTPAFLAVSVLLFVAYFGVLASRWDEFSHTVAQLYSFANLTLGAVVVLWFTALAVILIHELGHAFTCKYFGGEVHEMGFMLMYFQPAFYCNVNDAWSFPEVRSRLWVTAAGGWIQFVAAGLAALVWAIARPGTLAAEIAVAAMLIGGATTILTNMNPLIPLDGYFVLTDWLEIPNLRQRAQAYVAWWVRRNLLRLDMPEPSVSEREKRVFLIYGSLAACYIALLFTVIGMLVVGWARAALGALGVVLALAMIVAMARHAIAEWGRAIVLAVRTRRAERKRRWGWKRVAFLAAAVVLITGVVAALIPWNLTAAGRFVLAPVRTLDLVAPDSGILAEVFVRQGTRVPAGAPVARIVDRSLERELVAAARVVDSLSVGASRARAMSQTALVAQLDDQRAAASARLAAVRARIDALTLRARWNGVVTTPRVEEQAGRRVDFGTRILTIATVDSLEARVALEGAGATRVRAGQSVKLVTNAEPGSQVIASIVGVSPAGRGLVGVGNDAGAIEARVPVRTEGAWRAAATGEAKVEIQRSSLLGALWWAVRQRVRGDILL
jgi:multidrug efflux pump subunit AcrA (membrane-fusion protein)